MTSPTKFRSIQEVQRYLDEQATQIRQEMKLVDLNIKELTAMALRASTTVKIMDISGDGTTKTKKRRTVNVDFPVVDVPDKAKLQKNYAQAAKLSQQYKALVQTENEVKMTFRGATNVNYQSLMGNFVKLKTDIQTKLKELFTTLSKVAEGHAPKEYKKFLSNLAAELNENQHIECDSISTFTYVAVNDDGALVFAGYIVLVNAVSDENKTVPHLYVTVRWTVGGDVDVFVEHDFIEPTLLTSGVTVQDTKDAVKAIVSQLTLEGFSAQIGNLPISMQLRTPAGGLNKEAFTAAPFVESITADADLLTFNLKKDISPKDLESIKYQLYMEVKSLAKRKRSIKLKMRTPDAHTLEFTVSNLDQSGIGPEDLDFLAEKYRLSDSQLRRIANEINGD
jgi:hypothetical protein